MLLTSQERLQFPVLSLMSLNYEKKTSDWKGKYDDLYRAEEVNKVRRIEEDTEYYKVVYEDKIYRKREVKLVNDIASKVGKDQAYKKVYEYRSYSNNASSQIYFSRNVIIHINDDGQCVCTLIYLSSFFIKCILVDYPLNFFYQFLL